MNQPMLEPVSVVIRALNEAAQLSKLLKLIREQDYAGQLEIVVVDNESHDESAHVAREHGATVFNLPRAEFSYPKSMNLGMEAAHHEVVIMMVAHAYPVNSSWLAAGVSHFKDSDVAGVYANVIPYEDASVAEKAFYMPPYEVAKARGPHAVAAAGMGVFGATNCILRKSLWQRHLFDEQYGLGGEDSEWAGWVLRQGYKIINDYRFTVRHSHNLLASSLTDQYAYWSKLGKPSNFSREALAFRRDIDFS